VSREDLGHSHRTDLSLSLVVGLVSLDRAGSVVAQEAVAAQEAAVSVEQEPDWAQALGEAVWVCVA
jgi:hypothetical protein